MLDLSFLSLLIFNRFLNPISDVSTQFSPPWQARSWTSQYVAPQADTGGFHQYRQWGIPQNGWFLYIMEFPFTMDLGNGGYPKNIQLWLVMINGNTMENGLPKWIGTSIYEALSENLVPQLRWFLKPYFINPLQWSYIPESSCFGTHPHKYGNPRCSTNGPAKLSTASLHLGFNHLKIWVNAFEPCPISRK